LNSIFTRKALTVIMAVSESSAPVPVLPGYIVVLLQLQVLAQVSYLVLLVLGGRAVGMGSILTRQKP
jgi:hypothetical protein